MNESTQEYSVITLFRKQTGGPDSFDNCISLCPDCHSEVLAFNIRHPVGGTGYRPEELKRRRDDRYAVVKRRSQELAINLHRTPLNYPHNKLLRGTAQFNYSNHDGFFRMGEGNCEFLTHWTKRGDTSIYCYSDKTNGAIALAPKNIRLQDIKEASSLDFSSKVRNPYLNQFVVFENHFGRYAAAKILKIQDDTRGHSEDLLVFDYWILEDGDDDFSNTA